MKTIIAFLLAVGLAGFTQAFSQSLECPPGSQMYSVSLSIQYYCTQDGDPSGDPTLPFECPVNVTFCCLWDATNRTIVIRILDLQFSRWDCVLHIYYCGGFSINGWFWTKLSKALSEYAESVCWSDLPPCDDPNAIHIEVWRAQCQKYENVYIFNEWIPLLRPCSQYNICYRKYKLCWDFTQSPPRRVSIYLGSGVYGTPNCSATEPELPPNGRNWNEPWETNCFQTCQY